MNAEHGGVLFRPVGGERNHDTIAVRAMPGHRAAGRNRFVIGMRRKNKNSLGRQDHKFYARRELPGRGSVVQPQGGPRSAAGCRCE